MVSIYERINLFQNTDKTQYFKIKSIKCFFVGKYLLVLENTTYVFVYVISLKYNITT